MDAENQNSSNGFSLSSIKQKIKDKANHPSVSGSLIILLILNIVILYFGLSGKDECPAQKYIPIYLILSGCVGIVSKLLPFIYRRVELELIWWVVCLLYIFEFFWLICGCIWVYGIYKPNTDHRLSSYCDATVYYLAFWIVTINLALLILSVVLVCCASVCSCFVSRKK